MILFHSHGFGQIARLIDVRPHEHRRVVGQELHRHRIEQGMSKSVRAGKLDVRFHSATRALPRAATSCMLETVFSNSSSSGATTITGTFSSINAIGPCLSSPAA